MVSLKGKKVYLDANTLIYALEGVPQFSNLKSGLLALLQARELTITTSALTLLEVIVYPRRNGDLAGEQKFRSFLTPSDSMRIVPIDDGILERAADLRARHVSFRTPDAIHLATGIAAQCDLFLTADLAWSKAGVVVIDPAEVG